jgi:hypothetical protein
VAVALAVTTLALAAPSSLTWTIPTTLTRLAVLLKMGKRLKTRTRDNVEDTKLT